jgi:hypothetical protein
LNRQQLKARLDGDGVPERDYIIEGVDRSVRGLVEGGLVLAHHDDHWVVSVEERGQSEIDRVFTTEDDACDYLFQQLTERLPIGPPLTPDEIARAESLRRDQLAEHQRWVEEHRKEPH